MGRKLPTWLKRREDGAFVVDPDRIYPKVFELLGVKDADVDQYWVETAYQCAKLAVQALILDSDLDPRPSGMALTIVIDSGGGRKDRWALSKFQPGRGIHNPDVPGALAATKGREARGHFSRIAAQLLT